MLGSSTEVSPATPDVDFFNHFVHFVSRRFKMITTNVFLEIALLILHRSLLPSIVFPWSILLANILLSVFAHSLFVP